MSGTPGDAALGPNGMSQTELYMSKNVISSRLVQFGDISEKSKNCIFDLLRPAAAPPALVAGGAPPPPDPPEERYG